MLFPSSPVSGRCGSIRNKITPSLTTLAVLLLIALSATISNAFDYQISSDEESLKLTDIETGIDGLKTVFLNGKTKIDVVDLTWEEKENATGSTGTELLFWTTAVDGVVQASGNYTFGRVLPSTIEAGEVVISSNSIHKITVTLTVEGNAEPIEISKDVTAFQAWVSLIPLFLVLILAMTTHMVSFFLSILVHF
jgi:hypothetical protein